jgi:hypothetical protein
MDEDKTELALPLFLGNCAGEASSQRRERPLSRTKVAVFFSANRVVPRSLAFVPVVDDGYFFIYL